MARVVVAKVASGEMWAERGIVVVSEGMGGPVVRGLGSRKAVRGEAEF